MSDSKLSTTWRERWQALENTMEYMASRYSQLSNPTFKSLVDCLQAFGGDQFQFFHKGFRQGWLLPSMHYPAEHVLRATLDQVAFDISVIQRAVDQRVDGPPRMKTTLETADQLAQDAVNLACDNGLLKKTAVMTYFNKSANIRVIPYAPVALIGIPYTCLETARDYLAIPHEMGHYVYHHGEAVSAELHTEFPTQPAWLSRWIEEIFADVYGCLVAGPVIGLDFQDLLLDNSLKQFVNDDGEHPVDAIRPYIYTRVLAKIGFENAPGVLDKRWQKWLAKRNNPNTFVPRGGGVQASLVEARAKAEEAADSIVKYLLKTRQIKPATPWSADLATSDENAESLYTAFEARVNKPLDITVCRLVDSGDSVGVKAGEGELENARHKGATQTWRDWFKKESEKHNQDKLPAAAWMPIFTATFWPVKGPEDNSDSGYP